MVASRGSVQRFETVDCASTSRLIKTLSRVKCTQAWAAIYARSSNKQRRKVQAEEDVGAGCKCKAGEGTSDGKGGVAMVEGGRQKGSQGRSSQELR